jgi:LacI family transcriptional regulator
VPQDLSVVGIDDIELSRRVRPNLATVATPNAAAGRAAVDMLLQSSRSTDADDRRTTAQVTLQTQLIIRDSTGPGPHWPADPGYAAAAASVPVASYVKE